MRKKFAKKEIAATLRTMDPTKIHRLCVLVTGGHNVLEFVKTHAPSNIVYDAAYNIAYPHTHAHVSEEYKSRHGHFEPLPRQAARLFFQAQAANGLNAYTKVPTMGNTHLYSASPYYGHADYNKARILKIEGNERFCELLVKKYGINNYEQ